jgi:hypothetical protein
MEALLSHAYLNYTASADSSSYSDEYFNDICCLKKGPHLMKLLSISSLFFTTGFRVGAESLNHGASSPFVPICASTCAKIFIFIAYCELGFPLLSIFHLPSVKIVLGYNEIWSLQSEVIWAQEN